MKKTLRLISLAVIMLFAVACARHKIIPDDQLAQIFRDAFLTNAYIGQQNTPVDSLKIYEPIFARYGYTTNDVQYTIGNFSKRKSARLGDVVERAITMLETEGKYYNREVAILDTIDNVARRTFTTCVRRDSLIRVRKLRDTLRTTFDIDVQPGEYTVSFKYKIDSLDRNESGLRSTMWLERHDTTRTNLYSINMRRDREESQRQRFTVDSTHRRLHISLVGFYNKPLQPYVTLRDMKVEYTPPTAEAVEKLYEKQLNIRIFADEFFRAVAPKKKSYGSADPKDSL